MRSVTSFNVNSRGLPHAFPYPLNGYSMPGPDSNGNNQNHSGLMNNSFGKFSNSII